MPPVTTFAFLQNLCASRLRLRGANFSGSTTNSATDIGPPAQIRGLLNLGYAEFLSETLGSNICSIKVSFPTAVQTISYSLSPVPPNGATVNPAAMSVLKGTYTQGTGGVNAGYEYEFPIIGDSMFSKATGSYVRRLSWFGPRVQYACIMDGASRLDVAPGTDTVGDIITLTIVPDPANSPDTVTAANGGMLVNESDVPLLPSQFHMALVEYVVMNLGASVDRQMDVDKAFSKWTGYVAKAKTFGSVSGDGFPDKQQIDVWAGGF